MHRTELETAIRLHLAGDTQQAQAYYERVLRREPEQPTALRNLGLLALDAGFVDHAISLLNRALRHAAAEPFWYTALGQAYRRNQQPALALEAIAEARRREPDNPLHHYWYGEVLSDLGRLDEAVAAYERALALNPPLAEPRAALAQLALSGAYRFSPEQRQELQAMADDPALRPPQAALASFASANLLHAEQRYDEAFFYYHRANEAKRLSHPEREKYRHEDKLSRFQRHQAVFGAGLRGMTKERGAAGEQPVFIVGMLRTGTTLVEKVLASHSAVAACGELMHLRIIAETRLPARCGAPYPELLAGLGGKELAEQAEWYLHRIGAQYPGYRRWIDKMPTNYEYLGLIHLLFPNARIIHTRRDPLDTLWSCYCRNVHARFSNSFDDLASAYRLYRQYMDLWRRVLPLNMIEVDYEDLVTDFATQARRLIDFLGLEWEAGCLDFHKKQGQVNTPSRFQVRQPIYHHSIGAWKAYARHLAPLRERLADLLSD